MNFLRLIFFIWAVTPGTNLVAETLLIKNVTVVSAERNSPLPHADVLIEDGRITEVSVKSIKVHADKVIDGTNKYLTPGLMDSHVHLRTMPGIMRNPGIPAHLRALQQTFEENQPKAYLYYGVTEIVDLDQTKASLTPFLNMPIRPDVLHCTAIGVLDGYRTAGQTPQQVLSWHPHVVFDDAEGFKTPKGVDPAKHAPATLVKSIAEDGANCVKLFFEDGFGLANHWRILSDRLVQQIRKEAKKYNLPVVGHANAIDMHKIALDNEVDVIAHGLWNWNELENQPGIPPQIDTLVQRVVKQKAVFQPTFNVVEGLAEVMSDDVLKDPAYRKVVPNPMLDWYRTSEAKWFRQVLLSGDPELTPEHMRRVFYRKLDQNARVVKRLADLGHPLVLASDTPSSPTYAAQPGYSTHRELHQLFNAGVPLKQIFEAATLNNAKAFGIQEEYGTVTPGKKANLLLLSQNPLENIEAYDTIEQVVLRGQVIERAKLQAN